MANDEKAYIVGVKFANTWCNISPPSLFLPLFHINFLLAGTSQITIIISLASCDLYLNTTKSFYFAHINKSNIRQNGKTNNFFLVD